MMKFKKLILLCVVFAMCCSSIFAAEITYEVENNHLQISGDFGEDYAYRMIALQLNGPFESPTEFPEAVEAVGSDFAKLQKTEFVTIYLDENGTFRHSFYPQVGNRFYAVAAYAEGFDEVWTQSFLNVDDTLEGTVVSLLNDAETSTEIKGIFDNQDYYNILTYYYTVFRRIAADENKELVYDVLYNAKEQTPFTDLKGSYGDAIVPISAVVNIIEMNEEEAEDARLMASENLDIENAPLYDEYSEMSQTEQNNVFKRLVGVKYTTVGEFENSFDSAVFLQMVQSEKFKNNLKVLLNTYGAKYGVDIDGYSDNTSAVNNAVYGEYFKTTEELSDAVQKAVRDNEDEKPSLKPSGGSGGSGSGKGSGIAFGGGGYVAPITDKTENNVEKTEIFDDLDGVAWAKEAIEALYDNGVVNGKGENKFDPNGNVTREEFVKMLLIATGKSIKGDSIQFEDVNKDAWYYSYVATAVKLGWVKGISETVFGVGAPLTRQDMAVLIERAAGIESENSKGEFADDSLIADYAKDAVYSLRGAGIINGDNENRFNPGANTTRAEAAKVLYEIMKEGR